MEKKPPVGIIVCGALVLIASFMPWGSFRPGFMGIESPFGPMMVTVTAWNGNLNCLGMTIPNWFATICGVGGAIVGMLTATGIWNGRALGVALAAYGVFHSGMTIAILVGKGRIGIGALLMLGACIALGVLTLTSKAPAAAASTTQASS